jgi:hypothetical protein
MGSHHRGLKSFVSKTRYTDRISCEMTCFHHLIACYCKASAIDGHRIMAIRGHGSIYDHDIVIVMPRSKILLLDRVISHLFRRCHIFTLVRFKRMDEKAKGWESSSHIGNFLLRSGEGCVHLYEACRSDKKSLEIIEGGV